MTIARRILPLCLLGLISRLHGATIIDFNDGTAGQDVATFYTTLGVTFSNAEWSSLSSGFVPDPASTGLRLVANNQNLQPKSGSPIVISFDVPVSAASIIANNVNLNGARVDAYDQITGGSLLDFQQVVGASGSTNSNFTLSVSATSIRRLEIYQPFTAEAEGVLFDNLTFTPVPEPSIASLVLPALAFCARRRRP